MMFPYPVKLFGEYSIKDVDYVPKDLLITSLFEDEIIAEAEHFVFIKFFSLFSFSLKSYLEFFLEPGDSTPILFEVDVLKWEEDKDIYVSSTVEEYLITYDKKQNKFLIEETENLAFLKKRFYEKFSEYLDISIAEIKSSVDKEVLIKTTFSRLDFQGEALVDVKLSEVSLTLQAEYVF